MPIRRRQRDLGPPDVLARGVTVGDQGFKLLTVIRVQVKADVIASHVPKLTQETADGNLVSGGEH